MHRGGRGGGRKRGGGGGRGRGGPPQQQQQHHGSGGGSDPVMGGPHPQGMMMGPGGPGGPQIMMMGGPPPGAPPGVLMGGNMAHMMPMGGPVLLAPFQGAPPGGPLPPMGPPPGGPQPPPGPPPAPGAPPPGPRGGGGGGGGPRPPGAAVTAALDQDFCAHFVKTRKRPQNFLRDGLVDKYEGQPKLQRLVEAKDAQVRAHATPAMALRADLRKFRLSAANLGTRFDVVLIDPPWPEYTRRAAGLGRGGGDDWEWEDLAQLDIGSVMADVSCCFLWAGCEDGLEKGRKCLQAWGYRRMEEIVWLKTNTDDGRKYLSEVNQWRKSVLVHTKEHCLVGIRGQPSRVRQGHLLHSNLDTDIVVGPEPPLGSTEKPAELYGIIERFWNGRRRLELFGEDHNVRNGWVTIGDAITHSNFKPGTYASYFKDAEGHPYREPARGQAHPPGAPVLVPTTDEIEALRPRPPPEQGGPG
ncbi:MAG: MT-A70-domain-containing protein [Monoraphidium minutum]|nr:MAG: MT-A70-domain-containing protein [Monoraphidium minutum]